MVKGTKYARSSERPACSTLRLEGSGGSALSASAWGEPDWPSVLLLHGFGQSRLFWRETGASLAVAGFFALAPDARGHGASERAASGVYRLDEFVADAQALGQPLELPVMVGASIGGMVGMLAEAESARPIFRALVLVDIVPRWREAGVKRVLDFMASRPEGFDSLDEAAAAVGTYLSHRAPRRAAEGIQRYLRRAADGRWRWHWDPRLLHDVSPDPEAYHARLMRAARRITCPVLLISGAESDVVEGDGIAEFMQAVPHARHVAVKDARHMVAGDANDDFTAAVLDFLTGLAPSSENARYPL